MAYCSNQNLWQIIIGHSALRDPDLIEAEINACSERLVQGLAYYEEPSSLSEDRLKKLSEVKGKQLEFILDISSYLNLDQEQSLELYQCFLLDAYRGSVADLKSKLVSKREREALLHQVKEYYHSERLYILRCLKYLIGYWQDPSHPYREVYTSCLEEKINKDERTLIQGVLEQYEVCARAEVPSSVQASQEEASWVLQNLREQCELLEIILLYYKDYIHLASQLLKTARLFQALGFGLHQHSRMALVPHTHALVDHLSQLCSLILVEAIDLDLVSTYSNSSQYTTGSRFSEHHLMKDENNFKELDGVVSEWGDLHCHSPVLLAWTVFKFIVQPRTDIENTRLLGNKALQGNVFGYMLSILQSPYFNGDRPVANVCKSVLHTLLSLAVSSFNEDSLGDSMTLVSIAAETLTHPRLRLELWEKGTTTGIGLLLASALTRFPLELTPLLNLLQALARDPLSAHNTYQQLLEVPYYTEYLSAHITEEFVDPGDGDDSRTLIRPRTLYWEESRRLRGPSFTLPAGISGLVTRVGGIPAVCWQFVCSAWELFALETNRILHCPGIGMDPTPHPFVERVANIAILITQMLQQDWSLAPHVQPITSQYFTIMQKFSPLPNPPSQLLSAALKCIAVMARNDSCEVWSLLRQTGFLPYLHSQVQSISVTPGHYGQILNVWERPRGMYPVSMAMLDLLVGGAPPSDSAAANDHLACVVFVMREMFAGFHKWRYRNTRDKDQIGHKLLQMCHNILTQVSGNQSNLRCFLSHFLLHTLGGQSILNTLAIGVDTVNLFCSNSHSTSHTLPLVESLKLAFAVIDLLLQGKEEQSPTPLEQSLATQSSKRTADGTTTSHLIAVIASYIHHRDDPLVPAGATRLLMRLAQVAPMSMFACLGQDAVAIRDAYVNRLAASVEDTELKISILELITESVGSQPGMMELFLCIKSSKGTDPPTYTLDPESCLHSVLAMIDPDKQGPNCPPSLLHAAMALLRALWYGRHDAALIALRGQKDFWKHLTNPLFSDLQLDDVEEARAKEMAYELQVSCHVMHIVAMEAYCVMQNRMDKELSDVLKEFSTSGRYRIWSECLKSLATKEREAVSQELLEAQCQLVVAWRTALLVASRSQASVFHLSEGSTRSNVLEDLLHALESQLSTPVGDHMVPVAIATELSMLYMVLFKKWSRDVKLSGSIVDQFNRVLQHASNIDVTHTTELLTHVYSTLVMLLRAFRAQKEHLEPRFVLGVVPHIAEVLQKHQLYLRMECKNRPECVVVYLLNEIVQTLSEEAVWLPSLRQHSIVTILVRNLDEHLTLRSQEGYIEAILSFFISLSRMTPGAESLVVNGISQVLCISMADALAAKLQPTLPEKQVKVNGLGAHQPPSEWRRVWHLTLRLAASVVGSLGHQAIPQSLDFTGVYQERLSKALDIFESIHDLQSLEETLSVCQFIQRLAHYRNQWKFALPILHDVVIERAVCLASSTVAILSKRSTLKHIVKTMNSAGVLPVDCGPSLLGRGRVRTSSSSQSDLDDSWVTCSPAFSELQDKLVSILTACIGILKCYTPNLEAMLTDGALDLSEYPLLFTPTLSPPTVDYTLPPSLGTLTATLTTGLALMNKLDPHKIGTPSRSPSKSPLHPRTAATLQRRAEYLCLLEHTVILLLSQATRFLTDPSFDTHDKQVLRKELANELGNFSQGLLLNFARRGAPSPGSGTLRIHTPGGKLGGSGVSYETSSGKTSSLSFSDASEQGIFRLADSFAKQYFR